MKFIIITGPQAVGKMAIGMELGKRTGMRLFHNHMTIELVKDIYGDLNKEAWNLITKLREDIFDSVSKSDLQGFIFTFVWAYDLESDNLYIRNLIDKFEYESCETFIVELEADVNIRKERNKSELRLKHKPSKRDLNWSENELISCMNKYRLNSIDGEIDHNNYIKIHNTNKSEKEVVDIIIKEFKF